MHGIRKLNFNFCMPLYEIFCMIEAIFLYSFVTCIVLSLHRCRIGAGVLQFSKNPDSKSRIVFPTSRAGISISMSRFQKLGPEISPPKTFPKFVISLRFFFFHKFFPKKFYQIFFTKFVIHVPISNYPHK